MPPRETQEPPPSILIVEDEAILAMDIEASLLSLGYQVCGVVATGEEAVQHATLGTPSLILMDIRLQGSMDGIEAAALIRSRANIPVVYLTAHSEEEMLRRAKETEPFGYLIKPYRQRDLHVAIEIALRKHRSDRDLRISEARFRALFDWAGVGIALITPEGRIVEANPNLAEMLSYELEDLRGRLFWEMAASEDAPVERVLFQDLVAGRHDHYRVEVRHTLQDGLLAWRVATAREVAGADLYIRILSDISHERLEQLVAFQETERTIVACELHDTVSQPLAATYFRLQTAEHRIGSGGIGFQEVLATRQVIQRLLEEMSALIANLRTPVLDGDDLSAALLKMVADVRAQTGLAIHLALPSETIQTTPLSAFMVYRIVQEALRNAWRHSGASSARVTVQLLGGILSAVVEDAGAGFDPEEVRRRDGTGRRRHLGLRGMKERAELVGGRLVLDAAPGRGTRIQVEVPTGDRK